MKHSIKISTIVLVSFLLAQFIGIFIIYNNVDVLKSQETGKTEFKDLPIGERPPVEEGTSFLPVLIAILIGTGVLLLLMRYNLMIIWKLWFLLAVVFALTISWGTFAGKTAGLILALIAGIWKIFKPNFWIHNLTELFIYGGLAVVFVPLFNVFSAVVLLILISGYDAYAVWKSKHMIKMATTQARAKIFAGLLIPYTLGKEISKKQAKEKNVKLKKVKVRTAVLGGGDIGFPLIFAGVLLKEFGLWQSLIIPFGAALGLGVLLWNGKKDKFYPAMPFISAGCFLALGIVYLLQMFV